MGPAWFGVGIVVAAVLLAGAMGAASPARAQSDAELKALNSEVQELRRVAKYREALAVAERYVAAAKREHGEEHSEYGIAITWMARLLRDTNRWAEAEPLMRRALVIAEKSRGPEHHEVAAMLHNLADLLRTTNRHGEAEPLIRRALAIDEKAFGPEHTHVGFRLNDLALVLQATNRLADAEHAMRRALAIQEKSLGPDHPEVATVLSNLAILLKTTHRLAEAEPLMRRALTIDEKTFGSEHPNVGFRLNVLATLLMPEGLAEAEPLLRRALAINEKSWGPEHTTVAASLNALAAVLQLANRLAEAEPLYRRALVIYENSYGPDHPDVGVVINFLATVLADTDRPAEAELLMRRALAINEKSYGPEHPDVAFNLNVLVQLMHRQNRSPDEAEPLIRRALAITEKSFGPEHPNVAYDLFVLAQLLQAGGRLTEAETIYRRALAIHEKSYGPGLAVGIVLNALAELHEERGDWAGATRLYARAKPFMTGASQRRTGDQAGLVKAALTRNAGNLRAAARALHRANATSAEAREEGFELAQWALQTGAADALSQMSVRFAKGGGPLAQIVRERQDLVTLRIGEDRRLLAAVGEADVKATDVIRTSIAGLDATLDTIDRRLAAEFPEYASLANPKPLSISVVQALLKADEALVVFLDVPHFGKLPEETLAWAITKTEVRWLSIPLGTAALGERVAKLRCGLDRQGQWEWAGRVGRWLAKGERCRALQPDGLGPDEPLPFELAAAHELYQDLLAPFADLTQGKSLIIVPSGPLTSLPFHVLVGVRPSGSDTIAPPAKSEAATAKGGANVSDPKGLKPYRNAAWLALKQAITVLPSVGSLQALRKLPPSEAKEPYIAFGNPLLDGVGDEERAKQARAKQSCPQDLESLRQRVTAAAKTIPGLGTLFRGGSIDLAALRAQAPLPETADELCAVARALGALGREADTVWLGARATERNLKMLSHDGKLARYRVLHFATHGLLAGESEAILQAKAEPALLLNPPRDGASQAELDEDNGLLTASEVAQLEPRRRLGHTVRLQYGGGRQGRCRGALGARARLLLCQGPRPARLALVREFRRRSEAHYRRFR